jgi:STE24 endopeptidase
MLTIFGAFPAGPFGEPASRVALLAARFDASPRPIAAVVLGLLVVAAAAAAVVRVPWRRLPAPAADQRAALAALPADQVARSRRLRAELRPATYLSAVARLALAAGLGLTPAGAATVAWAARPFGGNWVTQALLGALTLTVAGSIIELPFGARRHAVLVRYALSTQTWGAWLADKAKALAVEAVVLSVAWLGLFGAGQLSPRWWWVGASGFLAAFTVLLAFVFPQVIAPIFNTYTPLEPGPLRQRLLALAAADDVPVTEIFVADASKRTTAVNAAVAGLGPTRRIIVFDTLLQRDPQRDAQPPRPSPTNAGTVPAMSDTLLHGGTDDQITAIVAHELAHAKYHDLLTMTMIGAVRLAALTCAVYLLAGWAPVLRMADVGSITDPRAIGLVNLTLAALAAVTGPATNLVSRRIESRADRHALDLTGDPQTIEDVCRRIAETNLADVQPGRVKHALCSTHPSILERIATAREYARRAPQPARQPVHDLAGR